ncbi:MAG: NADH-quinone oxidoreductase subunit C [Phycisphaerae bacterium]|nr:NADH-quinone oxidoreductase subunit C [Phycisphaerae bacterium]
MTPEDICKLLKEEFSDAVEEMVLEGAHPYAVISAGRWFEVARFLREDPRLNFNLLNCISSIDLLADNRLACVYEMCAVDAADLTQLIGWKHSFSVRVVVDRDKPVIPSVSSIWPTANWHEREAYDMMGIVFENHPDLRRILCPEDWEGHPLRKDYKFPVEYHGIPATTEYELNSPVH